MKNLLAVVAKVFSNTFNLIFFAAKMWVAFVKQKQHFAKQKQLIFFQQNISMYLPYFKTEILTSCKLTTFLSFEKLGPAQQKR